MQSNILFNFVPNAVLRNTIRLYARNKRKIPNPGLQKRVEVLSEKQTPTDIEDVDFDELETDFMEMGNIHKLHEHEETALREKEKYWIVRRKYFKENQVNFLTWNDKEQIRYLYNANPEEWTIDKLSEGFPALPETITKILKNKWQPRSENRKKNHDSRVENNWKLFKEGKLSDLPREVIHHVSKFSDRKPKINLIEEKIIINEHSKHIGHSGEYSSIIENYNRLLSNKNNITENISETQLNIDESTNNWRDKFTLKQKQNTNLITLSDLKKDIAKEIDSGKTVNEYDKMILKESPREHKEETKSTLQQNEKRIGGLQTYKVELNDKLANNEEKRVLDSLRYPERITIPTQKFKKGSTYKVNDCYYDDDGEFLYRVPGIY